jgi:hypothetical protein
MQRASGILVAKSLISLILLGAAYLSSAADTAYPQMAPVDEYLMKDRDAEIALARSAAPDSISRDAEVVVMGRQGFETAVAGKNGFLCVVGRGWSSAADPDYWNPKVRVPMCMNAAASQSYFLYVKRITELALKGQSPAQVNDAIVAAVANKELPPMAAGAMCYMMGRQGYGGDVAPHWPSHVMFFYTDADPAVWGANLKGSPVIAIADPAVHLTQFVIPVKTWADGTDVGPAKPHVHAAKSAQ